MLIFGLEGEMFFGSAVSLEAHFDAISARITPETRVVVLRVKRERNPDAVGMVLLDGFVEGVAKREVQVLLAGVRREMNDVLKRTGLARRLDDARTLPRSARASHGHHARGPAGMRDRWRSLRQLSEPEPLVVAGSR